MCPLLSSMSIAELQAEKDYWQRKYEELPPDDPRERVFFECVCVFDENLKEKQLEHAWGWLNSTFMANFTLAFLEQQKQKVFELLKNKKVTFFC